MVGGVQLKVGSQGVSIFLMFLIDFDVRWFREAFSSFLRSGQSGLL